MEEPSLGTSFANFVGWGWLIPFSPRAREACCCLLLLAQMVTLAPLPCYRVGNGRCGGGSSNCSTHQAAMRRELSGGREKGNEARKRRVKRHLRRRR